VTTAATASEQKLEQQISKYIKLFENCETNNFSHHIKVVITDHILYPNKEYLISKIHG
jgi:hypothetical protein